MKVASMNLSEFIIHSIAIKGEAKIEWLLRESGNEAYADKCIKGLIQKGLIKPPRSYDENISDGSTIVRLRKPGGLSLLNDTSPELRSMYDRLTGGHTFTGNEAMERRRIKQAELIHAFQTIGTDIDLISLKREPNIFGRTERTAPAVEVKGLSGKTLTKETTIYKKGCEPIPLSEVITSCEQGTSHYFIGKTTRTLQAKAGVTDRTPLTSSRLYGSYYGGGILYPVYCIYGIKERWSRSNEAGVANLFSRHSPALSRQDPQKGKTQMSCLIATKDLASTLELLPQAGKKGAGNICPWEVYAHAYAVAYSEFELVRYLDHPGSRVKLIKALFGDDSAPEDKYVDLRKNGVPIYETITGDLCKLNYAKKRNENCYIVTREETEEVLRRYFSPLTPKFISVSEEDVRKIIKELCRA